jgi:hypothetical protein
VSVLKKIFLICFVLALVGGPALMNDGIDFTAPAGGHAFSGTVRFVRTVVSTAQDDGIGTDAKAKP